MVSRAKRASAYIAVSLTLTLLTGGQALAGDHKKQHSGHHEKMMKKIDSDDDGRISQDEYTTFQNKKFDRMDSNDDGYIDADELKSLHQKRHPKPD